MSEEAFVDSLLRAFPDQVLSAEVQRPKRVSVLVKREAFLDLAVALRDDFGFTMPVSGGGVDYPKENRIQMCYYLTNPESRFVLIYRVDLPRDDLELSSLTQVWEAMSFHEREAHEMLGIYFKGHDNLIPLLLPPGWSALGRGFPLRKDFKLEGGKG